MEREGLTVRLLGELEVLRGDRAMAMPPSKKTRALLAYLIVTGRSHRRDRLCSLLWDVADDPRGALRWSLSKLRALLDEPGRARVVADRDSVGFELQGASVDLLEVRARLASGCEARPTEELVELARSFRGELLEGLDLGDQDEFQAWCVAEREQARRLHVSLLETLVSRLIPAPEQALPWARVLVNVDPLGHTARATLLRILVETSRRDEAEQQLKAGLRLLDEVGSKGSALLRVAWAELSQRSRAAVPAPHGGFDTPVVPAHAPQAPVPSVEPSGVLEVPPLTIRPTSLVGRRGERARLSALLRRVTEERRARAVLVSGEPGIGKSRLLEELLREARRQSGTVFSVSAHEADSGRPFGNWVDGLRQLPEGVVQRAVGGALSLLLPELGEVPDGERSRERLFGAVLQVVTRLGDEAPPVVLAFNDVQWSDASSSALLHYVARMSRRKPVLVAMTARSGELADNDAVCGMVRDLRRERLLEEIELCPLSLAETAELVGDAMADARQVFEQSAGNPLFALELARAGRGTGDLLPRNLTELVRDRLDRLPVEASDVLRWASVLGRVFDIERLAQLSSLDLDSVVSAVETLELHSLLKPSSGSTSVGHAFAHDVVRRVVYSGLSEPRRRMMHLRVARLLSAGEDPDEQRVAELAHHASLGGDASLAARACVSAGRLCLGLFANADAAQLARRGLRHAESLPDPERTRLSLELMDVAVRARRPESLAETALELEALAERAAALGAVEAARLGYHLVSHLRFEGGQFGDAERTTLRAELVSRDGDDQHHAVALAEAGRCLTMLERDLGRAEHLLREAESRTSSTDLRPFALELGLGMLRLRQGQYDDADEHLQRALSAARRRSDRAEEFQALEYLVMLELERERFARAEALCSELVAIAERLREGSEAPFAQALRALCRATAGDSAGREALSSALSALRLADAKHRLSYVLTRLALLEAGVRDIDSAREHAREALEIARLLDRPSEVALSHVALARAAAVAGEPEANRRHLGELERESLRGVSAFVEREVERLFAGRESRHG